MKPLLRTVVAICLLLGTHAHPENIEEVKELPPGKEPVVEAEESQPQARVERCSACSSTINLAKSPKEIVAALQSLPAGEVHTQQSFEGCSSSKGCAGIKLQDGKVTQKFGNLNAFGGNDAFKAASAFGSNVLGGKNTNEPFWWMGANSPFKNVNSESFQSKSSSYSSSGSSSGFAAQDLSKNAFLNPNGLNGQASFESSSYQKEFNVANNPFLNGNINRGQGNQAAQGFASNQNSNAFSSAFGSSQSSYSGGSTSSDKFAGVGYTGSSPAPFATATGSGSNVNLIQTAQKEFDFGQSQQTIGDDIFAGSTPAPGLGVQGDLQQTCAGQGSACVLKATCVGGAVNAANVPLASIQKQYCNTRTETCCRLVSSSVGQANLGIGFDAESQGSGLISHTATYDAQNSFSQSGFGVQSGSSSYDASQSTFGSTIGSNVPAVTAVPAGSTGSFGASGSSSGSYGSTLRPVTGQSSFGTDSFSSQSGNTNIYRPGSGSSLKPGIPYLPPVDNTNSGSNVVSSTAFPSTLVTSPRPFTTPRPVSSPRPFNTPLPVTTPRPLPSSRPTYLPPVSSTSAPGYLPPVGEQTINRETFVPSPNYNEGGIILDESRFPSTTRQPIVPILNEIPAGCAAALKCTPIEFCTADGIISNTTVVLTRDQNAYRVPLTDCRDLETGRIGKCCRDPFYTDPWPTNQLGQWVPGVFGGNDGKYVPDSRVSSSTSQQVTGTPFITGSTILNNFRTPKPTLPTFTGQGSGIKEVNGRGQITTGGVGQFGQGGIGQVTQTGIGQTGQVGVGQVGVGQRGQVGVGQVGQAGAGQRGQVGIGQTGQVGVGQIGIGQRGQVGVGQTGEVGVGQVGQVGFGQRGQVGVGQTGQVGVGQIGVGQRGQGGVGQIGQVGVGQKGQIGFSQTGQFGVGQIGIGQRGQVGVGQTGEVGVGQVGQVGFGQRGQVGVGQTGQVGVGQIGIGQRGQVGVGQTGEVGVGQVGQVGFGQRGQVGVGQTGQVGVGQIGIGQRGQVGVGQTGEVGVGQVGQVGFGQRGQVGVGQTGQFGVGQIGVGQRGQGGVGQIGQVGVGQIGQFGVGQTGETEVGQAGQFGIGQRGEVGVGQVGQVGVGQRGQVGFGQTGQVGVGQIGQVGVGQRGQIGVGQIGQFGVGQKGEAEEGQIGQFGVGQRSEVGIGQNGEIGVGQIGVTGVGKYGQFGVGQRGQVGIGQIGQVGVGQQGQIGVGLVGQTGTGQIGQTGVGAIDRGGQGQIGIREQTGGIGEVQGTGQRNKFGFVSQGITQVETGTGQYTENGIGQKVVQGGGVGIKQGVGLAISQGVGTAVENEVSASTRRIYLQRYDGAGQCGIKHPQRPYGNHDDLEVDFAEIPWQAMVLLQTNRSLLCGGVISRPDVVITSAACVDGLEAKNVLVKGGEWKLGIDEEPLPFQIVQVKTIVFHPGYKPGSLKDDVAILHLAENLRFANNIQPICMPDSKDSINAFYSGAGQCIVTGWGKIVLQAHLEGSIMHSVNMSLVEPTECESRLQQDYPHLLDNYDQESCACGQPSNSVDNVCKVDIGSALACTTGDGYFVLQGIYSWDSGCQIGNQLAAFYKFDIEWYEWAIGVSESVRYEVYGRGTKVTTTKYTSGTKGVFGQGQYTKFGVGQIGQDEAANTGKITTGQFGGGQLFGQGALATANFSQFGGAGSLDKFTKLGQGNLNLGADVKGPISNTFSATYTEKKFFQTEPKYITYTTKPEIVTYTTKPEYVTFTTKPEYVTYTTKPEYVTYTTKPEIFTYTTKPKIITYTTKPKIITYTTKPKIVTYTTKPQFITYETSGSGTNPQYVAPGVTFNPSFQELVAQHKHSEQCKCLENGKK
ncbi:unnamed protein product, partial [Iphiclides podalirius]